MSKFLKLDGICGKPFYVRKSAVIGMYESNRDGKPCTKVLLDGADPHYVLDTPEEVGQMVDGYV